MRLFVVLAGLALGVSGQSNILSAFSGFVQNHQGHAAEPIHDSDFETVNKVTDFVQWAGRKTHDAFSPPYSWMMQLGIDTYGLKHPWVRQYWSTPQQVADMMGLIMEPSEEDKKVLAETGASPPNLPVKALMNAAGAYVSGHDAQSAFIQTFRAGDPIREIVEMATGRKPANPLTLIPMVMGYQNPKTGPGFDDPVGMLLNSFMGSPAQSAPKVKSSPAKDPVTQMLTSMLGMGGKRGLDPLSRVLGTALPQDSVAVSSTTDASPVAQPATLSSAKKSRHTLIGVSTKDGPPNGDAAIDHDSSASADSPDLKKPTSVDVAKPSKPSSGQDLAMTIKQPQELVLGATEKALQPKVLGDSQSVAEPKVVLPKFETPVALVEPVVPAAPVVAHTEPAVSKTAPVESETPVAPIVAHVEPAVPITPAVIAPAATHTEVAAPTVVAHMESAAPTAAHVEPSAPVGETVAPVAPAVVVHAESAAPAVAHVEPSAPIKSNVPAVPQAQAEVDPLLKVFSGFLDAISPEKKGGERSDPILSLIKALLVPPPSSQGTSPPTSRSTDPMMSLVQGVLGSAADDPFMKIALTGAKVLASAGEGTHADNDILAEMAKSFLAPTLAKDKTNPLADIMLAMLSK
eukprot:c20879_g1_i1.p1 GENE.c20879_g1_i1~~c20879_g1_i1.p1  ORF type:complete len:630 (+),score=85.21 c20879_g1_i1:33-1922(+)